MKLPDVEVMVYAGTTLEEQRRINSDVYEEFLKELVRVCKKYGVEVRDSLGEIED